MMRVSDIRVMRPTSAARWDQARLRRRGRKQQTRVIRSRAIGGPVRTSPAREWQCGKAGRSHNPEVIGSNPFPATTKENTRPFGRVFFVIL